MTELPGQANHKVSQLHYCVVGLVIIGKVHAELIQHVSLPRGYEPVP
jgi:hypothetical protein